MCYFQRCTASLAPRNTYLTHIHIIQELFKRFWGVKRSVFTNCTILICFCLFLDAELFFLNRYVGRPGFYWRLDLYSIIGWSTNCWINSYFINAFRQCVIALVGDGGGQRFVILIISILPVIYIHFGITSILAKLHVNASAFVDVLTFTSLPWMIYGKGMCYKKVVKSDYFFCNLVLPHPRQCLFPFSPLLMLSVLPLRGTRDVT